MQYSFCYEFHFSLFMFMSVQKDERGGHRVKRFLTGLSAVFITFGTCLPLAMASTSSPSLSTSSSSVFSCPQSLSWFNASITVGEKTVNTPKGFSQNHESYLPICDLDDAMNQIGFKTSWNSGTHTWSLIILGDNPPPLTLNPSTGSGNTNGNTTIKVNGKLFAKVYTIMRIDPVSNMETTYIPVSVVQNLLKVLGAGSWRDDSDTLDINIPNNVTSAVSTNGTIAVTFSRAFTIAPGAGEFVVTGSTGFTTSVVSVSKVDMSDDMTLATLTIPVVPPTSGKPVPHYTVSYMGGAATKAYERIVAVNDETPGETIKTVKVGSTLTVSGVSDQRTPMPNVTFDSDNPSVATVAADGTVTARAPGVAHISATDAKDYIANVPFTVIVQAQNDPTISSVVLTDGTLTVVFHQPLIVIPVLDEFVVTESTESTKSTELSTREIQVSKVIMSPDMTTATLELLETPMISGESVPNYSVSFLGHTAVTVTVH
jgi:hypothetical protein